MNELTFEEFRQRPTPDKKDFEAYEISQITVKDKYMLQIDCVNFDDAEEAGKSLNSLLSISHRGIERKIVHPTGSSNVVITGKVSAEDLVIALATLHCISNELKDEIIKNPSFQSIMQSRTPEMKRK